MSSGINARFCAHCDKYMGIDTPSQKMHDNKFRKVDMWLVVEEVRAHQTVMAWSMVFGVVVAEVGASGVSVNLEVALEGAIPDPIEAHVDFI